MHYSEIKLISEIKKRNLDAFDYLIKEYTKPVYYLTYHYNERNKKRKKAT